MAVIDTWKQKPQRNQHQKQTPRNKHHKQNIKNLHPTPPPDKNNKPLVTRKSDCLFVKIFLMQFCYYHQKIRSIQQNLQVVPKNLSDNTSRLVQVLAWWHQVLTHCGPVTPCGITDLGQHWLRLCMLLGSTKPLPKPIAVYHQNTISIQESEFKNVLCKMVTILLTHKQLETYKCGVYSALWILIPWCQSTRSSVPIERVVV